MNIFVPIPNEASLLIPVMSSSVKAGFPSPADDYIERGLNLHEEYVHHPASTFFIKVSGDSMINAGICEDDLLIVDKSIEPGNGSVIVAVLNGEFTIKYFHRTSSGIILMPANPAYPKIKVLPEDDFRVWGVVTNAIHNL